MGGYQVDLLGLRNGGLPWTGYTHSEHAHGWCGPEHMSHYHHVALDDFSALPLEQCKAFRWRVLVLTENLQAQAAWCTCLW